MPLNRSAAPWGAPLGTMRPTPEGQMPPFEGTAVVGRGSLAGEYYEVGEALGQRLSYWKRLIKLLMLG